MSENWPRPSPKSARLSPRGPPGFSANPESKHVPEIDGGRWDRHYEKPRVHVCTKPPEKFRVEYMSEILSGAIFPEHGKIFG